MKILIFDSSTLISLALNGLFNEIQNLKKIFNGKFIITKEVYWEVVEKPISTKRFELEALEMKQLIDDKTLEFPDSLKINDKEITEKSKQIIEIANNSLIGKQGAVHLIDLGEASALALSSILNEKSIKNLVAIDERTTRMLCEKPKNMIDLLEKKLHTKLKINYENLKKIPEADIIRSSELVYIAWKKGIIKLTGPFVLDALLWAVKLKGCSISEDEIREIKRMK